MRVIATGIAPIKLAISIAATPTLLEAGAKYVIASEEQDLVAEVNKITNGKGVNVVFDPVAGPTITKLAEATAQGGIIFQYGALSTEPTPLPLFTVLSKQLTIRGYTLFELSTNPARLAKAKQFVIDGLASGKLKPTIAKTFPFEQIIDAHRYMESNQQIGKIVVTLG